MSKVYMIHFEEPYKHAKHYIGWSDNLSFRIAHHRAGTGARLMAAVCGANIRFVISRLWDGDRSFERSLKNRKNAPQMCPVCRGEVHVCYDCGKLLQDSRMAQASSDLQARRIQQHILLTPPDSFR